MKFCWLMLPLIAWSATFTMQTPSIAFTPGASAGTVVVAWTEMDALCGPEIREISSSAGQV